MIETFHIENTLKEAYLPVISNQLNTQIDPFLAKIKRTNSDVWGKHIHKLIRCDDNNPDKFVQCVSELASIYATIEIPKNIVKTNNAGVLANLINDMMHDMIETTGKRIRNAFYDEDIVEEPNFKIKLDGIKKIFNLDESLYSVDRKYKVVQPTKYNNITIDDIIYSIKNSDDDYDFIIANTDLYRKLQEKGELVQSDDCKYYSIEGVRLLKAPVEKNKVYLLNSKDFFLHQLCDWKWVSDETNNILKYNEATHKYRATLVKYCNIICDRPDKQIELEIKE